MPILFQPRFVELIRRGEKTVTRRRWQRARMKPGRVYQARMTRLGRPFALLRVASVVWEREPGAALDSYLAGLPMVERAHVLNEEAEREGFPSWQHFLHVWSEMHGAQAMEEPCWRVEFAVEEVCG
jgi:hypothetical protein